MEIKLLLPQGYVLYVKKLLHNFNKHCYKTETSYVVMTFFHFVPN